MREHSQHAVTPLAPGESSWLPPVIQKSHERSETFGLSASMRPDYDVLPRIELCLKREQHRVLCTHATPVMETLREQIVNSHSMIVLTDADGLILHSIGDDDFLKQAERVALRAGANWAEDRQGTNAIGTAIAERCATLVHGDQHYLAANRFLTCSSVPIFDAYGELTGVLDVTGERAGYHQHTMALVKMSAQLIENHLFAGTFRRAVRIAFHARPEFLGTLMEGIVAFTCDGRFLAANRSAQQQLALPVAALRAHTLSSLFGLTSAQLIDRARASTGAHFTLDLHHGATVCASVELPQAEWVGSHSLPALSAPARDEPTPRVAPALSHTLHETSRLAWLDTGDAQLAAVIAKLRKVIDRNIPILISGETGTGKELLAQAIHNDSPRANGPFVAVNCASIPESLIESELFGYEEGAFTGARRKGAPGKLMQANGGTLFLDEIGDMPYPLQVRLLRVLQERLVNPLGSIRSIRVDIAIVCATHRDLRDMIAQNTFREDLYYRLNGLVVKLPPLRERTDLAVVIDSMLSREALIAGNGQRLSVTPDVMALFHRSAWPGNFRQLANLLRTAAAMVDEDGEIRREHLPDDFFDTLTLPGRAVMTRVGGAGQSVGSGQPDTGEAAATAAVRGQTLGTGRAANVPVAPGGARLEDVATQAIAAALAQHGGNVSAAARALGISRNTIYRKMPALGAADGPHDIAAA